MMRRISQIITYLFHPLLIPVYGTLFYFQVTPKYSPLSQQSGNILPVFILTVIIPIISMLILKNLGLIKSQLLLRSEERIYPLLVSVLLLLMVLLRVIPNHYTPELYFYFLGLIIGGTTSLMIALLGKIISLHMAGLGSLLGFMVLLSLHFEKNIVVAISLCTLCCGLVAMARLYLRAHGRASILAGLLIGLFSQLFLIQFWV